MTVSRRATTAEPSRTGLSACQAVLKGAFPAAELVPGEEPEAGVVGFVVSNAEPDRVGGRLVLQAEPGYLDMLNGGIPDPSRVARVQGQADRLQLHVQHRDRVRLT